MSALLPAVIPAAGLSRRMGTPKQLLPWRQGAILTAVIAALQAGGCAPVVCVGACSTAHRRVVGHPVRRDREQSDFSPRGKAEFRLLASLCARQNQAVSKGEIARYVWPEEAGEIPDSNMDV